MVEQAFTLAAGPEDVLNYWEVIDVRLNKKVLFEPTPEEEPPYTIMMYSEYEFDKE